MSDAIATSGLVKSFRDTRALGGVDLRIRQGSVFGLLGPNGAGKMTTIRILATLLKPDAGTATVLGHDVVREARIVRQKVSLTGQYSTSLTARLANPAQAAAVLTALTGDSVDVAEFSVGNPSLDEVFFALTGRPAEPTGPEAKP